MDCSGGLCARRTPLCRRFPPSPLICPAPSRPAWLLTEDPAGTRDGMLCRPRPTRLPMLAASPYEWTAGCSAQRRRIDGGGTSDEWNLQLNAPLRIGGKAGIDRDLGDAGLQQAKAQLGAARNESARQCDLWLDWLDGPAGQGAVGQQVALQRPMPARWTNAAKPVTRPMLDLNVAMGDLAEVQRQRTRQRPPQAKAQATLRVRFPQIPLEARPLSDPLLLERGEAQWRAIIKDNSGMLQAAQLALKKAELTAARTRADRMPDPTVGVFTASERAAARRGG